jgi:uncharacterized protein (DUF1800 family)
MIMMPQDEITTPISLSLDPYIGPWNADLAGHLLRRTMFGPTYEQIQNSISLGLDATVAQLLTLPTITPPLNYDGNDAIVPFGETWVQSVFPTSNLQATEDSRRNSLAAWLMLRINTESFSILEKMTLFWQNHFAVPFTSDSRATYNYLEIVRANVLGNFKNMVKQVTIDPSMLIFLNGYSNSVYSPNENYAREFLELFTIGKGPQIGEGDYSNYTEIDVLAGSKIFTGWQIQGFGSATEPTTSSIFQSALHDTTDKILSSHFGGQVVTNGGDQEYSNYIDLVFEQPEVAHFICKKIYRYFVNYDLTQAVADTVISIMADTFIQNNFEVLPVVQQLLLSDHFYDVAVRGAIIKNPIEFFYSIMNATHGVPNYSLAINYEFYLNAYYLCSTSGMNYMQPPSVGGWSAYYQMPSFSKLWANSSYIKLRFDFIDWFTLWGGIDVAGNKWQVNHLVFLNGLSAPNDPVAVIDDMVSVFCPKGLSATNKAVLKWTLTNGLPDFEWTVQYDNYIADPTNATLSDPVRWRVALTLSSLFKTPEFQTI